MPRPSNQVIQRGPRGRFASGTKAGTPFLPGNPGGPGNPLGGKLEQWRHAIVEATDEGQVLRIWRKAMDQAEAGDHEARRFVFERLFGKTPQSFEVQSREPEKASRAAMLAVLHGDPRMLEMMNEMARAMSHHGVTKTDPDPTVRDV